MQVLINKRKGCVYRDGGANAKRLTNRQNIINFAAKNLKCGVSTIITDNYKMETIDIFLEEIRNMVSPDLVKLNNPATNKEFDTIRNKLGIKELPKDFVDLYNKFNGEHFQSIGILGNWRFMEIKHIIKEYKLMRKLLKKGIFNDTPPVKSEFVKNFWWNEHWLPFISSGSGHLICLDLDPNKKGTVGQVILFLHDDEKRPLLAKSIDKWFESINKDIKKGKYKYKDRSFSNEAFVKSSIEAQKIYK